MATQMDVIVIVASYITSEDAAVDLSALDDSYWQANLWAYDAAIVVTDAWNQLHLASRTGRSAGDVLVGPLHNAFTALFGGPFVAGKAPTLPVDRRLPEAALRPLVEGLPADSVRTLVVAQGLREADLEPVFTHSEWLETETVESTGKSPQDLTRVIANMMRQGARASTDKEHR